MLGRLAQSLFLLTALVAGAPAQDAARPAWKPIGPYRAHTRYLAATPAKPDVVYAAGEVLMGVAASRDAGTTWRSSLEALGEHHPTVAGLIVDPDNPDMLYAGTNRGIFKSTDGGGSWSLLSEDFISYGIFCRAPGQPATIYASKDGAVLRSDDEFRSWRVLRKFQSVTSLAAHPKDANVLLVGDGERFFVTHDGGKTWDGSVVDPERPGLIRPVAASPAHPLVFYAARELGGKAHGDLYRSTDGGQTWFRVFLLPEDEALRKRFQVCAVAATTDAPSRVFVATTAGLFLGSDEGNKIVFDAEPKLNHRRVLDVAVIPSAKRVYAATDNGVYVSSDLGKSWSVSFLGLPRPEIRQIAAMPGSQGQLLAVQPGTLHLWSHGQWEILRRDIHGLAVGGRMGDALFAVENGRAILGSFDRGTTWQTLLRTPERFTISSFTSAGRRILVFGHRGGHFDSPDEGATWDEIPATWDGLSYPQALVVDPRDESRLYVGIGAAVFVDGGSVGRSPAGKTPLPLKLCRSLDGGKTWLDAPKEGEVEGLKVDFAMAVAGSGAPGQTLYAAPLHGALVIRAAVARSRDGGKTWEAFGDQSGMGWVVSLAVDPEHAKTVYAGNSQGRVFVSLDEGASWEPLGGKLDCGGVRQILPRPNGEKAVYVATDNGVYHWPMEP